MLRNVFNSALNEVSSEREVTNTKRECIKNNALSKIERNHYSFLNFSTFKQYTCKAS